MGNTVTSQTSPGTSIIIQKRWATMLTVGVMLGLLLALLPGNAALGQGNTIDPLSLAIEAVRGETVTRSVRFTADDQGASMLAANTQDLQQTDGTAVIPAQNIRVDLPQGNTIDANRTGSVNITFDLKDAPSGRFEGGVILEFNTSDRVTIPISLTLKDPPLLPLLVLFFGIVAGVGLTWYRERGEPRDKLLIREARLRTELRAQPPTPAFLNRINAALVAYERAMANNNLTDADTQLSNANNIWYDWQANAGDWMQVQRFFDHKVAEINERIERSELYARFGPKLIEAMQAALNDVNATAKTVETHLRGYREDLERFDDMVKKVIDLTSKVSRVAVNRKPHWEAQVEALKVQLVNLQPGAPGDRDALMRAFVEANSSIANDFQLGGGTTRGGVAGVAEAMPWQPSPSENLPALRETGGRGLVTPLADPATRQMLYNVGSALVLFIVLLFMAWPTLYQDVPTFGVAGVGDYLSLFVGGFSLESARSVIADFLATSTIAVPKPQGVA